MDADEFIEFAEYAIEKDEKEQYKQTWNSVYPFMVTGSIKYMSFNEFYEQSTGRNIDTRPTEDIRREIEELHKKSKGG